jgi:hypothetical protein
MTTRKLHLPLAPDLHDALFDEARAEGIPAVRLARSVIENWLRERRRARQTEEIRRFAAQWAGTEFDLDRDLEAGGCEHLRKLDDDEAR